jgi:biotin carboxylase
VLVALAVPLAQVREELGIEGMDVATAHNARDKARMKTVRRPAGIPCARHQLVRYAG